VKLAFAVIVAFLVAAPVSLAKSDVTARLETALPRAAEPGESVRLAWSLGFPDDEGRRQPFEAGGVFIRLVSASGGESRVAFASPAAHPDGRYTAEIKVPEGGVGRVEVGLAGTRCTPDGCERSDLMFPVEGSTAGAVASVVPRSEGSSRAWLPWASTLAAAAAVLAGWLLARRRPVRGSSSRPL
jgi:hypothetical protein